MPLEFRPFVIFYIRCIDRLVYLTNVHLLLSIRQQYGSRAFEELLIHCIVNRIIPLDTCVVIIINNTPSIENSEPIPIPPPTPQ